MLPRPLPLAAVTATFSFLAQFKHEIARGVDVFRGKDPCQPLLNF
jgi:hypothetical protein